MREVAVQYYVDADTLGLAHILMSRWRDIEKVADVPGPSIHSITRTTIRRLL